MSLALRTVSEIRLLMISRSTQAARVLLRVDDVVQATRKERGQEQGGGGGGAPPEEAMEG